MSKVYFNVGSEEEQAIGPTLDSGRMTLYFVRRDRPTELIYAGGHPVSDAPSYNTSEGKINPRYKHLNGRNVVVEEQMNSDYVKSMNFTMMLPAKLQSVTDPIFQTQNTCVYDALFVPDECFEGCDEFFWLVEDIYLGATQITSGIIGWDDSEGPINRTRNVRGSGNFVKYNGLEYTVVDTGETNEFFAIGLYERGSGGGDCASCECPDQVLIRAGIDDSGTPGAVVVEKTENGGQTWSAFSATSSEVDIPVNIYFDGQRILMPTTDDPTGAAGSSGGILYIDGLSGTIEDATLGSASTGLHTIVRRGNVLYAFGAEAFRSLDGGLNWTAISLPGGFTDVILSSAIDQTTGNIFLGCTGGNALVYNGKSFVDITADITTTADLTAVSVPAPGVVQFGSADGKVEEAANYQGLGSTFIQYGLPGAGAYAVKALIGDGYNYRTFAVAWDAGVGTKFFIRDVFGNQEWRELSSVTAEFVSGTAGQILQYEGANSFFFAGVTGDVAVYSACGRCLIES